MITYKFNVLQELKSAGFTSYKLRKDKIFGEATMQKLRNGELVSWYNIDIICNLLNCQPGDLLSFQRDSD